VALAKEVDGVVTLLAGPQRFEVVPLDKAAPPADQAPEIFAFRQRVGRLQRAAQGAERAAEEAERRIEQIRNAILETPAADPALLADNARLDERMNRLLTRLRGDRTRDKRNEPSPPSIVQRVDEVVGSQWYATTPPTRTQRDAYRYAGTEFKGVLAELHTLVE